ncbi:hypothetical protein IW144_002752 [Coemansia sp. RSA 522]|nr:hypothetical protein IW144_002752 [Coemansia sp. RSA 522]
MIKLQFFSRFKKGTRAANHVEAVPVINQHMLRRSLSVSSIDSQVTLVETDAQYIIAAGALRRPLRQPRPNSQFTIGARRVIVC